MMHLRILICGTLLLQIIHIAIAAKILGLFAYNGKSHFIVFQPVLKELARRGHQLTVFSYFEHEPSTSNYTGRLLPKEKDTTAFLQMKTMDSVFDNMVQLYKFTSVYDKVLSLKEIQSLTNQKYDLVITEMFNSDIIFGLIYKIGAPVIGFSSSELFPWHNDALGNANNPSYNPAILSQLSPYMSLSDRLLNTIYLLGSRFAYNYIFLPEAQATAEKYLGKLPDLSEISANTSLLLVNTHFSLFGAKPIVPAVIEVGGVHMLPVKPLSKELLETINKYSGIIYFSMGSVLDSSSMSTEKKNIFLNVFSELKQGILWKRAQNIPDKSNNIILSDWYSQRDILAHPKTELFISHCGLLSLLEAVHSGVPILCIPMFGDQNHNAKAVATIEIGLILEYAKITEQSLRNALDTLINNPKYKENSKRIAKAFNDRPMSPLDTAIYWVEYVLRHKGAPHLRSTIKHLTWYQYYNLDVIIIYLCILYLIIKLLKVLIVTFLKCISKISLGKKVKVKSN